MTCTEEYQERIEYTFHAFCKVVIRNAMYTALRTRSRKNKREISLDYLTEEKHYPLGTEDEYFIVPQPGSQDTHDQGRITAFLPLTAGERISPLPVCTKKEPA